jgi:hypothetical protein
LLYNRIVEDGTLSEPGGVPDPQFALPSTVNWMRALALLVRHHGVSYAAARTLYVSSHKPQLSTHAENTVFEQLIFALHQLSALEAFRAVPQRADVARVGIVTWYYGIYYAASAMVAAQDGSFEENHSSTANAWGRLFAARNLAMPAFVYRVSTLVDKRARLCCPWEMRRKARRLDTRRPAARGRPPLWGIGLGIAAGTPPRKDQHARLPLLIDHVQAFEIDHWPAPSLSPQRFVDRYAREPSGETGSPRKPARLSNAFT